MRLAAVLVCCSCAFSADSSEITHQEITFEGQKRSYELFLPDRDSTPRALLLLMHPTGQREIRLAEAWKSLAAKEHIVLAAPSSTKIESWSLKDDPPAYINQVITDVATHHAVDPKRVYVFGFSAGAHYTIKLCLAFPASFAACGSAMGALEEKLFSSLDNLRGRVPLILFAGTEDTIVPASAVLATYKALQAKGFEVKFHNYPGQDHNYYRLSGEINKKAWEFMSVHELPTPQ